MNQLGKPGALEIRIGDVPLASKLDALAAALDAVQQAHRDDMSETSWAAISAAKAKIAEATLSINKGRLLRSNWGHGFAEGGHIP